jgi:hypothetical protein
MLRLPVNIGADQPGDSVKSMVNGGAGLSAVEILTKPDRTIKLSTGEDVPWPWGEESDADEETVRKNIEHERRVEERRADERRAEERRIEELRAAERRAEERRAEEHRIEAERRAEERRAEERRAEERRAEERRIEAERRAEIERLAEEERLVRAEHLIEWGVLTKFCPEEDCENSDCKFLHDYHRNMIICHDHGEDFGDTVCDCCDYERYPMTVDWEVHTIQLKNLRHFPQAMSAADIVTAGVSTTFCSTNCIRPACLSLDSSHRRLIFCREHLCTNAAPTCTCFPFSIDTLWSGEVDWERFSIDWRDLDNFPRWFLFRPPGQDRERDPLYIKAVKRLFGFNIDVPMDQRIPHPTGFYVKKSWVEQQQLHRW